MSMWRSLNHIMKSVSFDNSPQVISNSVVAAMQWTRGKPFPQPVQTWRDNGWRNVDVGTKQTRPTELTSFTVLSWNIDFRRSFTNERMQGALAFLEQYLHQLQHPAFILFNEMLESDLVLIQAQPWVRTRYNLTDISSEFWEHSYGRCPKFFGSS